MWGWKLTEVVGRNVKMLMPNPERDRHDGYLKRYLETGKQVRPELAWLRRVSVSECACVRV